MNRVFPFGSACSRSYFLSLRIGIAVLAAIVSPLATGKSPDELERLVRGIDWAFVMGGATPYADLSFRRKEDARAIPDDLVIGFKRGVSLPSGLNSGHQISLIIDHETLAYSTVKS